MASTLAFTAASDAFGEKPNQLWYKENFAFRGLRPQEICEKIVKGGDILTTQDFRDAEQEKKYKQVVDFLVKNAVEPKSGIPYTPERIKNALESSHFNLKNTSIESQVPEIIEAVSKVLPIKVEMKKVKIKIPSIHTGKAYGIVNQYKENEDRCTLIH